MAKKQFNFEDKSVDETLEALDSDPKEGLNSNEAASRKEKYGLNEIESEERNPIIEFLSHLFFQLLHNAGKISELSFLCCS